MLRVTERAVFAMGCETGRDAKTGPSRVGGAFLRGGVSSDDAEFATPFLREGLRLQRHAGWRKLKRHEDAGSGGDCVQ